MPKLVHADYQAPVYLIDKVELLFDIDAVDDTTLVTADLHYRFNAGTPGAPLVLDGEELSDVTFILNNETLTADRITITTEGDCELFSISDVPAQGVLRVQTKLKPWQNKSCAGLYGSEGMLLTQCEAQSFRKIIPYIDRPDNLAVFTCEIRGDQRKLPVLISNGNLIASGNLENGRHFARYQDPFPKPSYLFAVVAGDLACIRDQFITKSGKKVNLFVHARAELIAKAPLAMQAMKQSMKWDEDNYDLEYDLENCHLVAATDFNAGAMENKGLIIFNDECLLSDPRISTDEEQLYMYDCVSHEYFHNFAGNRVTVRSWLELALKEGLATKKETDFMTDTFGYAEYRISDVEELLVKQFPEDAGPLRHAVRPAEVDSIDNIYTTTVYTKGAELLGMLSRLLGRKVFTEGVKYYFEIYDGKAVTIEDFIYAQEKVSGRNLQQFLLWYTEPGTPELEFSGEYNQYLQSFTVKIKQNCVPPKQMPVAIGLLDNLGNDMLGTIMLELTQAEQSFTISNVYEAPVLSLLRDFSAPVKIVNTPILPEHNLFLFMHDIDPVSRWMNGQTYMQQLILGLSQQQKNSEPLVIPDRLITAFMNILQDNSLSMRLKERMLRVPSINSIIADQKSIDLDSLFAAREYLVYFIASNLEGLWSITYQNNYLYGHDELTPELIGKRAIANLSLQYLMKADPQAYGPACAEQLNAASNMTNTLAALKLLAGNQRALDSFYARWHKDHIAIGKWQKVQATSEADNAVEKLYALLEHQSFDIANPNHVYHVIREFGRSNMKNFHKQDGSGYKFMVDAILKIEPVNPDLAAGLLRVFSEWRKFDSGRQKLMLQQLLRVKALPNLSEAALDHVNKLLKDADPVFLMQLDLFATPLDFSNITVDKIRELVTKSCALEKATYDSLADCKQLSFATVVQPLINSDIASQVCDTLATLAMHIHQDEAVRDASAQAEQDLKKFSIEQFQRKDVYDLFKQYLDTIYPIEAASLTPEENRCVQERERSYRRAGLCLATAESRDQVTKIKKRLAEIETQFSNNVNEVKTSFEYPKSRLIGLPDDWFSAERLIREDIYKVTLKYPDVFPILDYCQDRQTRKEIFIAFSSRCSEENTPLFIEALKLRRQMAELLGYSSYADFATEEKMTKNAANVANFLSEMNGRFLPLQIKTLDEMTAFAREYEKDPNFELQYYDMRYFVKIRELQLCNVDHKAIKDYFSIDKLVSGTMQIYQNLLGLRFVQNTSNSVWHPDVSCFDVFDSASNQLLGMFYLDLHPREGKYGHAAVFDVIAGADLSKFTGQVGTRTKHQYAMLCNFPKNEGVEFDDVSTFFHEFGHIMHGICSRAQLTDYMGMQNEIDFVEAPSQMLENWCYNQKVLDMLSEHKDSKATIPAAMVAGVRDSEKLHAGYHQKRQLSFSTFDFTVHTLSLEQLDKLNLADYWHDLQRQITRLPTLPENFPASFNHLMGGYQVGYYGYMYSNVVALDMFDTVFAQNPLDPAAGMHYRKTILEPGASKDAIDLVKDFLGREPRIDAFLEFCGLESEQVVKPSLR